MTVDLGLLGHQNIPSTVLIVLGLSVVAYQVLIFIRVVLSIFVLPGKSVSCAARNPTESKSLTKSDPLVWRPGNMGSHHRCQRRHRQRVRSSNCETRVQSSPRLPHRLEALYTSRGTQEDIPRYPDRDLGNRLLSRPSL